MDRCPNCRARLNDGPNCRRCGLELGSLREVERGFDRLFVLALLHLASGDKEGAADRLRQALQLRHDPLAKSFLALLEAAPIHTSPRETPSLSPVSQVPTSSCE